MPRPFGVPAAFRRGARGPAFRDLPSPWPSIITLLVPSNCVRWSWQTNWAEFNGIPPHRQDGQVILCIMERYLGAVSQPSKTFGKGPSPERSWDDVDSSP